MAQFFKGKFGLVNMPILWDAARVTQATRRRNLTWKKKWKNRQVAAGGQVEKFLVNARCKRPATAASSASWNGGRSRHVGCFWVVVVDGPCCFNIRFLGGGLQFVSFRKRKLVRTPLKLMTTSATEIHSSWKHVWCSAAFLQGQETLLIGWFRLRKKSMDTLNGPLPGFRRPQGWHDIFLFVGDSKLHLHLPLSLGGGHTQWIHKLYSYLVLRNLI